MNRAPSAPCPKNRWLVWLIVALFAVEVVLILTGHYQCPFYAITGVPCPGCGLTRAGISLLQLDFAGAFALNPAIYLVALTAGFALLSLLLKKTWHTQVWPYGAMMVGVLLIYVVRMALYFPHTYPPGLERERPPLSNARRPLGPPRHLLPPPFCSPVKGGGKRGRTAEGGPSSGCGRAGLRAVAMARMQGTSSARLCGFASPAPSLCGRAPSLCGGPADGAGTVLAASTPLWANGAR